MFKTQLLNQKTSSSPLTSQLFVWYQPQLFSLFIVVLILFIISLVVFLKARKAEVKKAPRGLLLVAEAFVGAFDNFFDDLTDKNIEFSRQYFFSLFVFLICGNLLGLIGLEAIATSYSVPLALTLITWTGIRIIELFHKRWKLLKKYLNPFNIIGDVAPLLSLSIRMFGNIIGGTTIVSLLYLLGAYLFGALTGISNVFILAPIITPFFHVYFDFFGALIQSYVFTLLSVLFWSGAAEKTIIEENKEKKALKKIWKAHKRKSQLLLAKTKN